MFLKLGMLPPRCVGVGGGGGGGGGAGNRLLFSSQTSCGISTSLN